MTCANIRHKPLFPFYHTAFHFFFLPFNTFFCQSPYLATGVVITMIELQCTFFLHIHSHKYNGTCVRACLNLCVTLSEFYLFSTIFLFFFATFVFCCFCTHPVGSNVRFCFFPFIAFLLVCSCSVFAGFCGPLPL